MAFQPENMPELKIFFLNTKSAGEGDDDKIIQLSFNYGVFNKENNKFSELETFNNYINIRGNLSEYATQKYGITKEDIEKSEYLENFIFKILFYISQADVVLGFDTEKQVSQLNNEISTLKIGYKLGENVSDIKEIASNKLNKEINSIEELYSSLFGEGYAIGYGEAPLLSKCFFKLFDTSEKVYEVLSSNGGNNKLGNVVNIPQILQNSIYGGLIDNWKDNEEAIRFLTLVAEGKKSIFLTGKAGSGKSTLIKDIIKTAEEKGKAPVVLGSTGMAAMNIGGKTVHSFYGLGISTIYYHDLLKYIQLHKKRRHYVLSKAKLSQLKEAPFVIIDEVSMLRSDVVDCVNALMSHELQNSGYDTEGLSFGGKQVIFVGDVHQLPPVKRNERTMKFNDKYDSEWFFDSHTFKNQLSIPQLFDENNFDYRILELKKNYRQKNSSEFLKVLDDIRECTISTEDIDMLNNRVSKVIDTDSIFLASKVDIAKRINDDRLASLPGKEYLFQGKVSDKFPNELKRAADELRLKIGARVMFLVNENIDKPRYVNGSIGVLKDVIENGDKTKLVVTLDGNDYEIGKNTWLNTEWVKEDGKWVEKARGKFTQFPFQLAYAITIHKSQGLTLDKAQIDSVNLFTGGQGYVALSRVKSLAGLKLVGKIRKEDLYFSDKVFHFKDFMIKKIEEDLIKDANNSNVSIGNGGIIKDKKPAAEDIEEINDDLATYFARLKTDELCFSKLTKLTMKTAEILSEFKGKCLRFPALKEISGIEALNISRFGGEELDLGGLTKLSDESAKYLSEFSGKILGLSGILNLGQNQIRALAEFGGEILDLSSFDNISNSFKKALEKNIKTVIFKDSDETEDSDNLYQYEENGVLGVNIESLNENYIRQLAKYKGNRVDITIKDGVIDKHQCEVLARFKGKELCIEGLKSFPPAEALRLIEFGGDLLQVGISGGNFMYDTLRQLIKFNGNHLIISGFDQLQEGQEEILVKFKGNELGIFGNLTDDQKAFFDRFEGITIGDYDTSEEENDDSDSDDEDNIEENDDQEEQEEQENEDETNFDTESDIKVESKNGVLSVLGDHITDEQMRQYISYSGNTLVFNLRHLSDYQTQLLTIFPGKTIKIYGIESITDEQAKHLSKIKCGYLQLSDLKFLDNEQARYLSLYQGGTLDLGGLIMLNEIQANYLSKFKGDCLYLWRVPFFNDKEIESLSKFGGDSLYLGGITNLTDTQASCLGKFKGDSLDLSGLKELSDNQAKSLAEFRGTVLDLSGLEKISGKQLSYFNRFKEKGNLRLSDNLTTE